VVQIELCVAHCGFGGLKSRLRGQLIRRALLDILS
jgi:hypothetical protein